jgi:SAM-dependent methyltransferase
MSKRKDKKRSKKKPVEHWRTAKGADRHELYELSVQNVESEIDFVDQVWTALRGRLATSIREDFCGTFQTCVEWIARRPENTAICIDLDEEVLDWGRSNSFSRLDEAEQKRVTVLQADVMTLECDLVDTVLAMNFSYYLFKTRDALRAYFVRVREGLKDDGIFICDAYGGSESFSEMEEERDLDGFTYVWDQSSYSPVSGDVINHIHFRFPDKTKMEKAFTYEWRLWTLPELKELLAEAGFKNITVWWEGTDDEGDGDGEFEPNKIGEACEGWIAYLTAEK